MPFLFVQYTSSDLKRYAYTLYKKSRVELPPGGDNATLYKGRSLSIQKKGSRPESLLPQNQVLFKPDPLLIILYH